MGGLFGDPWKIDNVVEGDLPRVAAELQFPLNDQDLSEPEAIIAYINSVASGMQPLDSDLTAIAALATTSFGRGLLVLANAAALRSAAGLIIGTDVQAQDSDLSAIAALATTSFGRGLLTLASAASGWGSPTGTATRTTFDTATVTLPQAAEHLKAVIDDLKTLGLFSA